MWCCCNVSVNLTTARIRLTLPADKLTERWWPLRRDSLSCRKLKSVLIDTCKYFKYVYKYRSLSDPAGRRASREELCGHSSAEGKNKNCLSCESSPASHRYQPSCSYLTWNLVPGVRHLLWPVRQSAARAGDDRHSGTWDLPGLVSSLGRAAPQTTGSGRNSAVVSLTVRRLWNKTGAGSVKTGQNETNLNESVEISSLEWFKLIIHVVQSLKKCYVWF